MPASDVPTTHPRYLSLITRERIVAGVERGVTSLHGLIAHGRGEAFDYLLGERTHPFAERAIAAAAAVLKAARHPVISVNGNACALAAGDLVRLAKATGARLEVNIFHTSPEREQAIRAMLLEAGADRVLMPSRTHAISHIDHNRKWVHPEGILMADVVCVPLEDGDRCEALVKNGKQVITIDLNPLSRTARTAQITIVDNLTRCLPLLADLAEFSMPGSGTALSDWDNQAVLSEAETAMRTPRSPS
ncbi:MAG: phosphopantothenate/pantothenate synthetase [Verrucomicrobiaceae bacterium]|nr:MAG: phosphopantothenate/pantothenate synthetase [Verrucomicrobiaceae bacterium]